MAQLANVQLSTKKEEKKRERKTDTTHQKLLKKTSTAV